MDNKTLTLAQRLKKFRESVTVDGRPISARAFAFSINVDQSHYNKCEKGERNLSEDNYKDIQSLYGLNLNWLLSGEGSMFLSTSDKIHEMSKAGFPKPNKWERLLSLPFEIIKGKPTTAEDTKTISDYLSELSEAQKEFEDLQKELDELKKNRNKDK